MLVHKCNFLQLSLTINAIFFKFLVQQKLALVIIISSFLRDLLIARKHSLCIVKSRESIIVTIQMCKVGESGF